MSKRTSADGRVAILGAAERGEMTMSAILDLADDLCNARRRALRDLRVEAMQSGQFERLAEIEREIEASGRITDALCRAYAADRTTPPPKS